MRFVVILGRGKSDSRRTGYHWGMPVNASPRRHLSRKRERKLNIWRVLRRTRSVPARRTRPGQGSTPSQETARGFSPPRCTRFDRTKNLTVVPPLSLSSFLPPSPPRRRSHPRPVDCRLSPIFSAIPHARIIRIIPRLIPVETDDNYCQFVVAFFPLAPPPRPCGSRFCIIRVITDSQRSRRSPRLSAANNRISWTKIAKRRRGRGRERSITSA